MATLLRRALEELGLVALWTSCSDTKLLCIQRFVRLFAYGSSTLVLVSYLAALDISKTQIGLFMTLTLIGDTLISFILTLFADALGRKTILALGAALMSAAGLTFALSGNYLVLLAAAIVGVISPSGNEIGPFRAIEESTLAQLTASANRSDIYAWYSLIGTAGTAFGSLSCGWIIHYMRTDLQWDTIRSYRAIFVGYAIFGAIKFLLVVSLSPAVESDRDSKPARSDVETAPLLGNGNSKPAKERSWLPQISAESRLIVVDLCVLFALDSFASGLIPLSWSIWYFHDTFDLAEGKLGSLFFVTSIISACSMLAASAISKRFGNIKTMVFTHLPSAIFLALIPIPSTLPLAMVFLILRACTQSMDTAPRSAFLAAVIQPHERTAIMGLINVVKTSAQSGGPLITGLLASHGVIWIAFVTAGSLKATYDLGMLATFAGQKTCEEREGEADEQARAEEERARQEELLRESEDVDER